MGASLAWLTRTWFAAVVIGLALAAAGAHGAVSQTIYAYFDVDGGLQVRYADSSNVGSTIPPGTYTINLNNNGADDLGVDHIFHLTGPGVDYKAANVDTSAVLSVTFQPGATYRVFDDLNPTISQTIVATNAPAPVTPNPLSSRPVTGSSKPTTSGIVGSEVGPPVLGSLDATVSTAGKVGLTRKGTTVRSLKQGRYSFAVDDRSRTAGFEVESARGKPVTISSDIFLGTHHVIVTLKPGRWFFSSPGGSRKSFSVVS